MVPNFPRYMSYKVTHAFFFFLHLENILFERVGYNFNVDVY
jgi:hypothetical protein